MLLEADLADRGAAVCAAHDVPTSGLVLEITESMVVADPDRAMETLERLAALGVVLAVDDFGTGYSLLEYLKVLPVDEGVETDDVRGALAALGCHHGQGYLFSRALPPGPSCAGSRRRTGRGWTRRRSTRRCAPSPARARSCPPSPTASPVERPDTAGAPPPFPA